MAGRLLPEKVLGAHRAPRDAQYSKCEFQAAARGRPTATLKEPQTLPSSGRRFSGPPIVVAFYSHPGTQACSGATGGDAGQTHVARRPAGRLDPRAFDPVPGRPSRSGRSAGRGSVAARLAPTAAARGNRDRDRTDSPTGGPATWLCWHQAPRPFWRGCPPVRN